MHLDVATIGSRFGALPNTLPSPHLPAFNFERLQALLPDAIAIALLGSIESLLSAVVADGMSGARHRSNCELAAQGIAYVPFFPLGGFSPLQSDALAGVASRLGATPMQVALAWLLARSPNILLIPGTSSVAHLRENLAAATLELPQSAVGRLDGIAAAAT